MTIPYPAVRMSALFLILISFGGIFLLWLIGAAATERISFGPPIKLLNVVNQLELRDFIAGLTPKFFLGLAATLSIVVCHCFSHSRRLRVFALVSGLLLPLLLIGGISIKILYAWFLAIPKAPFFSFDAIAGVTDGEFYSEGFLVYTAMGWWMIFCLVLLCFEVAHKRHKPASV